MAQTRRKRKSKHRGTAAGAIEAKGRTSRPLSADARKKQSRVDARERRLNTPPTWKASTFRAGFAAALIFLFVFLLNSKVKNRVTSAALLAALAFLIYVPAGYYMELAMFRRRQRRSARGGK